MKELLFSFLILIIVIATMSIFSFYDLYFTLGNILKTLTSGIFILICWSIIIFISYISERLKQ